MIPAKFMPASLVALALVFGVSPSLMAEESPETKIASRINGQRFAHKIDDTRTSWLHGPFNTKTSLGRVGVEHILDGGSMHVESIDFRPVGMRGLTPRYRLAVRLHARGDYRQKHFRGIGHEYHVKDSHRPEASLELVWELGGAQGLTHLATTVLVDGTRGRAIELIKHAVRTHTEALVKPLL